jgi:hypothetical protein
VSAYGSVSTGYDPGYLLRESSKGAEGYYLSAVAEIGEPPGVWTGRACAALGLAAGAEVEPAVMEAMYGRLLDPRDPRFADAGVPDEGKSRLGSAPRQYKSAEARLAELLDREPDADPERIAQLEIQARKETRSAVMFFDFTFSVDKSTSVLHASLQAAAARAERAGDADAAAGFLRQARIVEEAIRAGSAAAVGYLQDEAGYSRAGYHGGIPKDDHGRPLARHATGRFVDAHDWVVASFLQHTSRDGDPQLHVHNAILNRAECADGPWRTIDSRGLHKARAAASAIGGRVMDEMIARELAAAYEQRPDGRGRELAGVPQQVKDMFSSRRAAITEGVAELAAAYEARHGRAPSARALFSMAQYVTLAGRRSKPKRAHAQTREEMLDGWAAQMGAAELGALDAIPARVAGTQDPGAAGIDELAGEEVDRVLAAAVGDVQARHAVWSRSQLLAAIDAQLPGWLGGLDAAAVRYVLDDLTSRALAGYGVVSLEAPDLVPVPAALTRADGRSVYTPHDRGLFSTRPHLDAEEQLMAAAGQTAGPAADPARVAAALGADPDALAALPGRVPPAAAAMIPAAEDEAAPGREFAGGLRADQAAAVFGIMTSGRPVDILIGPAGSGKSRTMGTLAGMWREHAGGNVIGVATAENAAQVLAAEGIGRACNITRFLAAAARRTMLSTGDLLIVDEAAMVPTADLTALHAIAAAAGAKLLLTGDPAQMPSVGAGGALGMLAREHGYHQLTQVQRMTEPWEREASLKLRDGDAAVLADYDRHGRLTQGTAEEMGEAAYRGWLADHLQGLDSLLIAATNEQAADLSARARAELAALGQVEDQGQILLSDGNAAGVGDLVQARRNDRAILDRDGRWAANRDVWRIEGYETDPLSERPQQVIVRRDLGRDQAGERRWSGPFAVPADYLRGAAVLGYAGTAHSAQGRTVDTAHAVVTEALTRALVYVAMTRGRTANYAYVVTDPAAGRAPDPGRELGDETAGQQRSTDLRPGTRPAPALETPGRETPEQVRDTARARAAEPGPDGAGAPWAPEADRLSVLAAALEREPDDPTALDARRDEAERAGHMAHLGAIWADLAAEESGRRYDAILRRLLTADQYRRLQAEDARATLHRQVRNAELAGIPPARLLARAVALRPLDDDPHRGPAGDIARVLHYRIDQEIAGDPAPRPATFTERTPTAADPDVGEYLRRLGAALDARTAELGRRAALRPPRWALGRLGPVPAGPGDRAEWSRRAGVVQAYREQYGHADPARPIGREPAAPEARAAWHAAAAALGTDPARLSLAAATDGELHARRARYERELAWAPPHVGDRLRATALARREHQAEAVIARARANTADPGARAAAEARARAHEQQAALLARRQGLLEQIDAERARWHNETEQARDDAFRATAELRRRHPDAGPLSYRDPRHRDDPASEAARPPGPPGGPAPRPPDGPPGPAPGGRPEPTPAELAARSFPPGPPRPRRPGPPRPGRQPARRPPEPPGRDDPSPSL